MDIIEELERILINPRLIVLKPVEEELMRLRDGAGPKEEKSINLALMLLDHCETLDVERQPGESVDDLIVRLAAARGYIVGTTDSKLRRRLRLKGVPVVYLRQKSHLEIEGWTGSSIF